MLIRRRDQAPFAFAGLWERWKDPSDGTVIRSCTIITCPANELVAPIHDRMPVILAPERPRRWLDPAAGDARSLLRAVPGGVARELPGQPAGQQPEHDDPDCIQPAVVQDTLAL